MGICFSCTKVKTSGCTRNVRTGETHTDPDTEIQLCIIGARRRRLDGPLNLWGGRSYDQRHKHH